MSSIRRALRTLMVAIVSAASACGAPAVEDATAGESDALSHAELPGADAPYFTLGHFTTNAMAGGELEANGTAEYVVGEEEGSLLMVHVMTPELDGATVNVYRMDTGAAVSDEAPSDSYFEGRAPVTAAYKVEVTAGDAPTEFSVEIEVPRRLEMDGQSADIVSWLPPHAPITYLVEGTAGKTLQLSMAGAPAGAYLTLHALDDGTAILGSSDGATTIDAPLSADAYLLRIHGGDEAGEFTMQASLH